MVGFTGVFFSFDLDILTRIPLDLELLPVVRLGLCEFKVSVSLSEERMIDEKTSKEFSQSVLLAKVLFDIFSFEKCNIKASVGAGISSIDGKKTVDTVTKSTEKYLIKTSDGQAIQREYLLNSTSEEPQVSEANSQSLAFSLGFIIDYKIHRVFLLIK